VDEILGNHLSTFLQRAPANYLRITFKSDTSDSVSPLAGEKKLNRISKFPPENYTQHPDCIDVAETVVMLAQPQEGATFCRRFRSSKYTS
jgi:hypothetical protein